MNRITRHSVPYLLGISVFALVGAHLASATEVLTFEGLQDEEPIGNYYNGGYGGDGSGPGPNYGITFGSDSLAIISNLDGGNGNFNNNPSGDTVAFFLTGPGDTMDVAGGFNTGFSFYYCSPIYTGSVYVYGGLDGTGTLLATVNLPSTPPGPGPNTYSLWEADGVAFAGTAESAVFTGVANYIGFDNITLGSATPGSGSGVPDSGSAITLLGLAIAGLGIIRRKLD